MMVKTHDSLHEVTRVAAAGYTRGEAEDRLEAVVHLDIY